MGGSRSFTYHFAVEFVEMNLTYFINNLFVFECYKTKTCAKGSISGLGAANNAGPTGFWPQDAPASGRVRRRPVSRRRDLNVSHSRADFKCLDLVWIVGQLLDICLEFNIYQRGEQALPQWLTINHAETVRLSSTSWRRFSLASGPNLFSLPLGLVLQAHWLDSWLARSEREQRTVCYWTEINLHRSPVSFWSSSGLLAVWLALNERQQTKRGFSSQTAGDAPAIDQVELALA